MGSRMRLRRRRPNIPEVNMRSLEDQLAAYAAYRDVRNIATHFIGIPLIVVSLLALLSAGVGADGCRFRRPTRW
ncbi:DUF962 domain-containing protein [Serratia ureilytica]